MNHTLESYRLFPLVAWVLVISFAVFTYLLAVRVNEDMTGLGSNMSDLESRIDRLEVTQGLQ